MKKLNVEAVNAFGKSVDFGKTANDYDKHRQGFPGRFFNELVERNYIEPGQTAIDVGTGTGTVALGLARKGLSVIGVDPAEPLLEKATALAEKDHLPASFRTGTAENIFANSKTIDLVTAGQCWHWFDRSRASAEIMRVLKPGGRIVIAHFDWLPVRGSVVAATEQLILAANPKWALAGGCGIYPEWLSDLSNAGFTELETCSFDENVSYTHEAWRGRIRASAGIKASLSLDETDRFDAELDLMLKRDFSKDPLEIPHRMWMVTGTKPMSDQADNH